MLITRNNNWEIGSRKRTVRPELKVGPVSLKFVTIALIAVAALFYLAQSTQISAKKYTIMEFNETKTELEAKGKDLEVQAARLKSLNEIKKNVENSDLEPIGQTKYIEEGNKQARLN